MKTWFVCTPEYWTSPQIMYGDPDPGEHGCDIVEVQARTKRDAKIIAVRAFRKADCKYLQDAGNPFTGITAETFDDYPNGDTPLCSCLAYETEGHMSDCEWQALIAEIENV